MEAIRFANDSGIDVVLVDTAGRMQDNEPLMRALTKLIKVSVQMHVIYYQKNRMKHEIYTKINYR